MYQRIEAIILFLLLAIQTRHYCNNYTYIGTHESVQREQDGNLRLRHLGIGMNDLQQQVTEMEQQLQRLSERRPTGKEGHAQDGRNTTSNSQVATSHNVASWVS